MKNQTKYWDTKGYKKESTTKFDIDLFNLFVNKNDTICDYGCGYGRILSLLDMNGFSNLTGYDVSKKMVERGIKENPSLQFNVLNNEYEIESKYDAVILNGVLTCIIKDNEQLDLMSHLYKILNKNGIIYISDFLLNTDQRNIIRYSKHLDNYRQYGVFELDDGAILRHHSLQWVLALTKPFKKLFFKETSFPTMNNNKSKGFTFVGRKNY